MQNLRLAVRTLRASPVVTVVAVVSLALGIGANTAIFSLVSSLLLRSLPVADPERLAMVSTSASSGGRQQYSYATFDQIRGHADIFDGALAYTDCCGTAILNLGSENQSADRQFVSGDFFTHITPLSTARASRHGRPRPSGRRFSSNNGSMIVHRSSVRSMPVRYDESTVTAYENTSNLTVIGGTFTSCDPFGIPSMSHWTGAAIIV
jgi:hypothetical protein